MTQSPDQIEKARKLAVCKRRPCLSVSGSFWSCASCPISCQGAGKIAVMNNRAKKWLKDHGVEYAEKR